MDASRRVSDLIVISERLADFLAMENRALRAGRFDETRALVEQKDELSRAYESRIKGLAEHAGAEAIGAVEPALREQLRTLGSKVQELSRENARLLKIAMEVNRRVLNEVAQAIKAGQPGPGTYSRTGELASGAFRASPVNTPISLNKSL
jgi:flagellar biosynthesis/type III secretory pathway chaperone